ncbi:hypothetical protein [Treponema sp. OMZ 857]|uniref:hypothetical protein n=1 Tax=Treponema sp. OMZ 857 TaxID=1643513 RepID=UPI0020A547CC|nr:hypothetical protein [Treponema sp. OMZ 857]UTC44875.1 hypothetical protein E4N66_12725 [Treponema sp. OMZ 857]
MEKQQQEAKIIRIAAELFPFVQQKNTACMEFLTLRAKLTDAVWRWALLTFNPEKIENATLEIMECVNRSVLSYEGSAEHYIHYLARSLKQEINRANIKLHTFHSEIIPLPENKRRKWNRLCAAAAHYGKDIERVETQVWLAKQTGYTVNEIAPLIEWKAQTTMQSEHIDSENGNGYSLFDSATVCIQNGYKTADAFLIEQDHIEHCLRLIDAAFTASQDRTKPYLSALLTHRVLCELDAAKTDSAVIAEVLHNTRFADTEHGRTLIRLFFEAENLPTQEDIAAQFGKDKTDASRTISSFIKKLQKICQLAE